MNYYLEGTGSMRNVCFYFYIILVSFNAFSLSEWVIADGKVKACRVTTSGKVEEVSDFSRCISELGVYYYYRYTDDRVTGCNLVTAKDRIYIKEAPVDQCVAKTSTYIKSAFNYSSNSYECFQHAKFKDLKIKQLEISENFRECKKNQNLSFYWKGTHRKQCEAYDEEKRRFSIVEDDRYCSSAKHIVEKGGSLEVIAIPVELVGKSLVEIEVYQKKLRDEELRLQKEKMSRSVNLGIWGKKRTADADQFKWVVEGEKVVGCLDSKQVNKAEVKSCDLTKNHLPKSCLELRKSFSEVIDVTSQSCRDSYHTALFWTDVDSKTCSEVAKLSSHQAAILQRAPIEECGYNQIDIAPREQTSTVLRLVFHPLSNFTEEDLVPEIMDLPKGSVIPFDVYDKYPVNHIAMTLVYQKGLHEGYSFEEGNYDYQHNTQIKMAFRDKYTDSIIEHGFLNQHQTWTTGGCACRHNRSNAEDKFFNYRFEDKYIEDKENPVHFLRPKYSYATFDALDSGENPLRSMSYGYGNVFAVFHTYIKDRATFTMRDSLDSFATSPKVRSFRYTDSKTPVGLKKSDTSDRSYTESQVYGEVTVDDVAYFLVNCDGFSQVGAKYIEHLKASVSAPVYQCEVLKHESRVVDVIKGQKL